MTVLAPCVDGWRSEDGYVLTMRRGPYSKRPIGDLQTPDGEHHVLAGARRDNAADLLDRAERVVCEHRRSGRIR